MEHYVDHSLLTRIVSWVFMVSTQSAPLNWTIIFTMKQVSLCWTISKFSCTHLVHLSQVCKVLSVSTNLANNFQVLSRYLVSKSGSATSSTPRHHFNFSTFARHIPDFNITTSSYTEKTKSGVVKELDSSETSGTSEDGDSMKKMTKGSFSAHQISECSRDSNTAINLEEYGQKLWDDTVARVTQQPEKQLSRPGKSGN